jgi:aspartate/glutamate racemase
MSHWWPNLGQGGLELGIFDETGHLVGELAVAGAQAVVLGCTDLGSVVRDLPLPLPVIDSTEVLAEALVREARA